MKQICIWLIRFYQKFLSPLKRRPTCRFTPTCSAYAVEAFQKRGFFVGFGLTVWRILRCNPFGKCGYDPVPEKKSKKNKQYKKIPKYQRGTESKLDEHNENPK
jgi:putative membrane protein insertion efficiency factor